MYADLGLSISYRPRSFQGLDRPEMKTESIDRDLGFFDSKLSTVKFWK